MSQQPIPRHGSGDPLNEMFLSPRVIDRTAFEQFTEKLNDLIGNAQRRETTLNQVTADAAEVEHRLNQAAIELEVKADRVAGLIPTLDERLEQIESILHETVAKAAQPNLIRAHVERLIACRLDTLDVEMDDIFRQAKERIQNAESTSIHLESDNSNRVDQLEQKLIAIETRLNAIHQQNNHPDPTEFASLNAQAKETRDLLAMAILSAASRVDALSEQSEEVIAILDSCLVQTKDEADKMVTQRDSCENSVHDSMVQLEEIASDASQRLAMMLASLTEKEVAARELARELTDLVAAMHSLRIEDKGTEDTPPSFKEAA